MSSFNKFFKSRGAETIVKKFLYGVDSYSSKYKLTEIEFEVIDETQPASYFIENELTACFKVEITYTVNYGKERLSTYFEVPKEVDGIFIIEGAYRIATAHLTNDLECKFNLSDSNPSKNYINFDWYRKYMVGPRELRIRKFDEELGAVVGYRNIKLDDLDKYKDDKDLALSQYQAKKLRIKLDLDYLPTYISKEIVEKCVEFGDDKLKDLIIDKKIESVPRGFMNFLLTGSNNRNLYRTRRSIANYWAKWGKLPEPINYISSLCRRYFKGSSDQPKGNSNDLQISNNVNALNIEAITNKIQIPESIAYNKTMADLICVATTPINQNSGKQNALTVSTHLTDEGVLFDVYTKQFQKVTIAYLDYLDKKVCTSKYVDYKTKSMKPNENNMVEVKYRMKKKMVPIDEVDLIDLPPDYRLSEEARRIPFINYTDSVRVNMGGSMLKQAIPIVNAERPLVDTGNDEELSNNVLTSKFEYDSGVVKSIDERNIKIELPNKEIIDVPRRTAIQSINDIDIFTVPRVKVGQKLKRGDIVTSANEVEPDAFKVGLNTLVLYSAHLGLVNEDAVIISESYAKKLRSYGFIDIAMDISNSMIVDWIAPIGTKVKSLDSVLTVNKVNNLNVVNQALQDKLGGIFGTKVDVSQYVTKLNLKVPNNIDEAYVADVLIQENKDPKSKSKKAADSEMTHKGSDALIEEYNRSLDTERKKIYERYPEYIASDRLRPVSFDDKSPKVVYTIRIRLIKTQDAMVGSKITNMWGGKGCVSAVKPDDEMPVVVWEDGRKQTVECILNPYSTINRKIPSVNMSYLLGNIAHKLYDKVEEMKKDTSKKKEILPLLEKYYPGRYTEMKTDEFIKYHNTHKLEDVYGFKVGSYSKLTPQKIEDWAEELGVKSQSKILIPTKTIADFKELKKNLDPEEYDKVVKDMEGKYVEVDRPLSVGYLYMLNLQHIPTYSNKSTSSMFGVDIDQYENSPICGRGAYRMTGQKISEMDLWSYLSKNPKKFIEEARGNTLIEDNQRFLNNLLGLGLTITDGNGYNQGGSSLKQRIEDMKVKFGGKK